MSQVHSSRVLCNAMIIMVTASLLVLSGCHRHHRSATTAKPQSTIVKRQLNSDGTYYVRKGDTLYAIAFSYGLDPMNVAQMNGISSPYTIYPGQKIKLTAPATGSQSGKSTSGVQISAANSPGQITTKTVKSPTSSTRSSPEPVKTAPAASTSKPTTNSTSDKQATSTKQPASSKSDPQAWTWPASGRVLRGFVAGDPARNGLDIAGKEGQPITVSAAGQVVYSGNGLIGYGELIIVKHSEKMLSAYAHNRVRLVKEGDQVWAGQKIAEMGRNSSNEQLLHFEIRALGKPVNPMNYLPKK